MRKKLILIQFSRALVPILVMLYHISVNMNGYFDYNFLGLSSLSSTGGVHFFFALSGFMLFYVYKEKFGVKGQIKKYLLNRFIRIYPSYWILTFIAGIILLFFPFLGLGNEINYEAVVFSILLIPHPDGIVPILDVAWSLIYTVYFYIIFSFLFLSSRTISAIVLSIWLFITLGFVTNTFWSYDSLPYYFFYEYNLIFSVGVLCAYLFNKIKLNFPLSAMIAGIGFIAFPFLWINEVHQFINLRYELSLGLASAFVIFGLASIDLQKDIKLPKFLNYLGNASLSIYLAHNLPLNAFSHLFYKFGIFEVIGGVATSIILLILITCVGCLVYSYIEKPVVAFMKKVIFETNKV